MNNKVSVEDLISRGYIKVGSKSYCSYWKKGDHTVTLYDEPVDELQQLRNKLKEVLDKLENSQEQHWKAWKEKADVTDQGSSTAYEHSYWLLKEVLEND